MSEIIQWLQSMVDQLLQVSPPVLLAMVLYALGLGLKRSPLADWIIPWILGGLGALCFPFIVEVAKLNYEVRNPFILHAIYGLAIGAMPTWAHQSIKQFREREKKDDGGTKFITKKDTDEDSTKP